MGFLGLFVHLIFHSSFSPYRPIVKFFVKDFSGTIKARSLKLGMQCSNDELYHVRDNWLSLSYLFFHFSFCLYRPMLNYSSKISQEL